MTVVVGFDRTDSYPSICKTEHVRREVCDMSLFSILLGDLLIIGDKCTELY